MSKIEISIFSHQIHIKVEKLSSGPLGLRSAFAYTLPGIKYAKENNQTNGTHTVGSIRTLVWGQDKVKKHSKQWEPLG